MAIRCKRRDDWITKVDAEIANWPGVNFSREFGGNRHNRVILSFGEQSRFVPYPSSPTKCPRAILNHISEVKRTLRELGAERVTKKELTPRKKVPSDSATETNHKETNYDGLRERISRYQAS